MKQSSINKYITPNMIYDDLGFAKIKKVNVNQRLLSVKISSHKKKKIKTDGAALANNYNELQNHYSRDTHPFDNCKELSKSQIKKLRKKSAKARYQLTQLG